MFSHWTQNRTNNIYQNFGSFSVHNTICLNNGTMSKLNTLVVSSATWSQGGDYFCVISYNQTSYNSERVNASFIEKVNIITDTAISYQVALCTSVTLNCTTINHDSVTWQKISSTGYLKNISNYISVVNDQLIIHEAGPGDGGTYICMAKNQVSSASITAEVIIGR